MPGDTLRAGGAFDRRLARLVCLIGRAMGVLLLAIVAVIVFDVLTRGSFYVGSSALQELEWHLHTTVLMLTLGYAYLTDSHVRIGLVRDHLSPRTQAAIEAAGCLLMLFPFTLVAIYYGFGYAMTSFSQLEGSPSPGGLPYRFIVKATVPLGMLLLFLAGVVVLVRAVRVLVRGPADTTGLFRTGREPVA